MWDHMAQLKHEVNRHKKIVLCLKEMKTVSVTEHSFKNDPQMKKSCEIWKLAETLRLVFYTDNASERLQ